MQYCLILMPYTLDEIPLEIKRKPNEKSESKLQNLSKKTSQSPNIITYNLVKVDCEQTITSKASGEIGKS